MMIRTKTKSKQARSRISNGHAFMQGEVSLNTAEGRRWSDLVAEYVEFAGPESTEMKRQLARRAATLHYLLERQEAEIISGGGNGMDIEQYARCAGQMTRILEALGLNRKPNINPKKQASDRAVEDFARYLDKPFTGPLVDEEPPDAFELLDGDDDLEDDDDDIQAPAPKPKPNGKRRATREARR